jgi:aminoglycoside phosphotransferase (APT) family kinase protein
MAVDAVLLAGPGGATQRLVLRRGLRPGWEQDDPAHTASREAAVLIALADTDVPAPHLVAVDPDGAEVGVPALLMRHVDGRRPSLLDEVRPDRIAAMAAELARIHVLGEDLRTLAVPFRPYYEHASLRIPAASGNAPLWRAAIAATGREPLPAAASLLHRDYHPGNTIWQGRRLAGIVDWAGVALGPAAADLAHWRANLGVRHGIEIADRVLGAYEAVTGAVPADQAFWDVRLLLDFLDDPDGLVGSDLAAFEAYLAALLRRL